MTGRAGRERRRECVRSGYQSLQHSYPSGRRAALDSNVSCCRARAADFYKAKARRRGRHRARAVVQSVTGNCPVPENCGHITPVTCSAHSSSKRRAERRLEELWARHCAQAGRA